MKIITVRELRAAIPHLKEALAREQELVLMSNGEAVARILPVHARRQVASLAGHRSRMTMLPASMESVVRGERDKR